MAKVWTKEKLAALQVYLNEGYTYEEIAHKMDKSIDSIDHTIRRYKLNKNRTVSSPETAKLSKEVAAKEHVASTLEKLDDKYFEKLKKKAKASWNIPKTTIKANDTKKPFVSYLVIGDMHVPEHNMPCIKAILYMMDDVKFDGLVNIGDFMDLACISHWNKTKRLTSEGMKIKEDYIIGNTILDEFDKRLPKGCDKHFMFGNHEEWYYQFIDLNPSLEGMFHPTDELKLKERGYTVYEHYNDIFSIGKLSFTHGIYTGMHYVKKHIDELKTNVIFGHLHSQRERYESSPAKELSIGGYALGCLCSMSPEYMKKRPNKWTNGFAIVHFYPNGDFEVELKRIIRGKFIYDGKVYNGNR
jgi:transposase-like protein/predicted phosphodiesterase